MDLAVCKTILAIAKMNLSVCISILKVVKIEPVRQNVWGLLNKLWTLLPVFSPGSLEKP